MAPFGSYTKHQVSSSYSKGLSNTLTGLLYHLVQHNKMAIDAENFKLETPQFNPRFPYQNQTKHCAQSYVDYHKCVSIKGEEFEPCKIFFKTFTSLCPLDWVEKWDDQRAAGKFPVKMD